MEKGPIGTHRMEKGSSGDFYDELQALRMSNYRSHRYTSDAEGPSKDFYDELQASSDTQAVGSHRSDGDGERSHRYT